MIDQISLVSHRAGAQKEKMRAARLLDPSTIHWQWQPMPMAMAGRDYGADMSILLLTITTQF